MKLGALAKPAGFALAAAFAAVSIVTAPMAAEYGGEHRKPDHSNGLPLPSSMPPGDYERILYRWLMTFTYKNLGWTADAGVRDTGPFIQSKSYGTHPSVRIYYSPEIARWLEGGRQGTVEDGAVIVKEMYLPPAELYETLIKTPEYAENPAGREALLGGLVSAWTVMVRDSKGSKDGWYWAGPGAPGQGESVSDAIERQLDDGSRPPYSGFGLACLRCHSSAETEFTFASLDNINGEPLRFRVDESWREESYFQQYPLNRIADDPFVETLFNLPAPLRPWKEADAGPGAATAAGFAPLAHMRQPEPESLKISSIPLDAPNPDFVNTFDPLEDSDRSDIRAFPMQWNDHVAADPGGADLYITSDNCLGCHGGLGGSPYPVTMFVKTGPGYGEGYNISEYGEWRWSPMGLAGRDPIFHAQLESEMALLERDGRMNPSPLVGTVGENRRAVANTCLSCHGAMGQRQLALDAKTRNNLDPDFKVEYFYLSERRSAKDPVPPGYEYHKYGELAREGISCAVCHHMKPADADTVRNWKPAAGLLDPSAGRQLAYFLFHNTTGRFESGPADRLYGPFGDVRVKPMENALGVTPAKEPYIQDSQLCGSCHTINLPNIGMKHDAFPVLTEAEQNPSLRPYPHTIEQATFLEWQNSAFGVTGPEFQSCQDCHMPGGFETLDGSVSIDQVVTQIAAIEDTSYPAAEHGLPAEDIRVPFRADYRRHEHVGLNVFLLEMFNQFPSILGVDKTDYMTSAATGAELALDNMIRQARELTADISVDSLELNGNRLSAGVSVTNKTGHRFPSGVAFRRAFIEFLVLDGGEIVWGSGRANGAGVIVDAAGDPLATEFLPAAESYQPHHQVITSSTQAQIYEELNQNAMREFTTSFVHRVHIVKDNRLLPRGWRESGHFADQGGIMEQFMEATDPHGVGDDPDYADRGPSFEGRDRLRYEIDLPAGVDPSRISVRATLYYQAIPPYWLRQRFDTAPDGEATRRLYYLTSRLNLDGTPMENWKLRIVSAERALTGRQ